MIRFISFFLWLYASVVKPLLVRMRKLDVPTAPYKQNLPKATEPHSFGSSRSKAPTLPPGGGRLLRDPALTGNHSRR
jgi:hypothetical protein